MKINTLSSIWAFLYFGFGVGLFLIPVQFMDMYGVALDAQGALMARILGSALIASAIVFILNRNIPVTDKAWRNLLIASCIYNLLDIPVVLTATLHGVMNVLGWLPVGLHVFLASTMAFFIFKIPAK